MQVNEGRVETDSVDDIIEDLISDAKTYFGDDLNDTELSVIRMFYAPAAEKIQETQEVVATTLDSVQIDHAEKEALDILTNHIGVTRKPAEKAFGQVTFSRDTDATTDYTIPKGTEVQTDSSVPIRFETTETVTLSSGTKEVTADIEAQEDGKKGNVGANTITVLTNGVTGVEDVTNSSKTEGGSEEETDEELRERSKEELGQGSRASGGAIINQIRKINGVTNVSIFINDTNNDNTGSGGLPEHSFEAVVSGGKDAEIAQTILDTKAAGDTDYAGAYGTATSADADLPNGQTETVNFSRPNDVQIYVDIALTKTDDFLGKDEVRDRIADYIGGLYSSGNETGGELKTGDDVLIGEVEYAIRDVKGVHDVTSLEIGKSSNPTGTSNIGIAKEEQAKVDGTDGSITFTLSDK